MSVPQNTKIRDSKQSRSALAAKTGARTTERLDGGGASHLEESPDGDKVGIKPTIRKKVVRANVAKATRRIPQILKRNNSRSIRGHGLRKNPRSIPKTLPTSAPPK